MQLNTFQTINDSSSDIIVKYIDILKVLHKQILELEEVGKDVKQYVEIQQLVLVRIKTELEKAKEKRFIVDLAQLPKTYNMEKWLEYFDLGIVFINSNNEI